MFTLHTEPRVDPPEFTVTYRSQGGPVTAVQWTVNDIFINTNGNVFNQSQLVLDASNNSVYANKLHIRGRRSGTYSCLIFVFGKNVLPLYKRRFMKILIDGMQF